MKFSDLEFKPHPILPGHIRAVYEGFSIIRGEYSYGGRRGLWEAMTPEGTVIGHLTEQEVVDLICTYARFTEFCGAHG